MIYNPPEFSKYKLIAGFDEAGRGSIAGPVVAAGVILDKTKPIENLNDSKKVSAKKREQLRKKIIKHCIDYYISVVPNNIIDEINILQASLYAMTNGFYSIQTKADLFLVDGNKLPPNFPKEQSIAVVGGDGTFAAIAAASILAKTTRDSIMLQFDKTFTKYHFKQNKGYPTKKHIQALYNYGITPIHRQSFKPIAQSSFYKCKIEN